MVYAVRAGMSRLGHTVKSFRAYRRCDNGKLIEQLHEAPLSTSSLDIDERWHHWKSVFLDVIEKHIPMVKYRVRRDSLPLVDANIRHLMRKRNRLRKKANYSRDPELWNQYKTYRNQVTASLRNGKQIFFSSLASNSSQSARQTWRHLNKLLGKCNSKGQTVKVSDGNDALAFSDHFSRCCSRSIVTIAKVCMDVRMCLM